MRQEKVEQKAHSADDGRAHIWLLSPMTGSSYILRYRSLTSLLKPLRGYFFGLS